MKKIIFSIIILFFLLSCGKNKDNCPSEFVIPGTVSPYQETYHIGDTITLTSKYYKYVYETNTKKEYNLENISFSSALSISRIDTGTVDDAFKTKTSNYVNITYCNNAEWSWFHFSDGQDIINTSHLLSKDTFNLTINIILKKTGLLLLEFGGGLMDSHQEFEGKCQRTPFDVHMRLNNPKDNNIGLLAESPIEYYNDWLPRHQDKFYNRGSFVLRVVE